MQFHFLDLESLPLDFDFFRWGDGERDDLDEADPEDEAELGERRRLELLDLPFDRFLVPRVLDLDLDLDEEDFERDDL